MLGAVKCFYKVNRGGKNSLLFKGKKEGVRKGSVYGRLDIVSHNQRM